MKRLFASASALFSFSILLTLPVSARADGPFQPEMSCFEALGQPLYAARDGTSARSILNQDGLELSDVLGFEETAQKSEFTHLRFFTADGEFDAWFRTPSKDTAFFCVDGLTGAAASAVDITNSKNFRDTWSSEEEGPFQPRSATMTEESGASCKDSMLEKGGFNTIHAHQVGQSAQGAAQRLLDTKLADKIQEEYANWKKTKGYIPLSARRRGYLAGPGRDLNHDPAHWDEKRKQQALSDLQSCMSSLSGLKDPEYVHLQELTRREIDKFKKASAPSGVLNGAGDTPNANGGF